MNLKSENASIVMKKLKGEGKMKLGTLKGSMFLLGICMSVSLTMAENIKFNSIRTGGVGCPGETTQISVAPDLSAASLIFDRFESRVPLQMPNGSLRGMVDVPCNVFVELGLPANHRLEAVEVSYDVRGSTFLDPGVEGSFRSFLMSIAGNSVPNTRQVREVIQKVWNNTYVEQQDDFYVKHSQTIPLVSTCSNGNDRIMMHVQHHVKTEIRSGDLLSKEGFIIMDSSDLNGGLKLRARIVLCSGGGNGGGNGGGQVCRTVIVRGRPVQSCTNR